MNASQITYHIDQANLLQAAMQRANEAPDHIALVDLDGKGGKLMKTEEIRAAIEQHERLAREAAA